MKETQRPCDLNEVLRSVIVRMLIVKKVDNYTHEQFVTEFLVAAGPWIALHPPPPPHACCTYGQADRYPLMTSIINQINWLNNREVHSKKFALILHLSLLHTQGLRDTTYQKQYEISVINCI